jgi:hypothetical protein
MTRIVRPMAAVPAGSDLLYRNSAQVASTPPRRGGYPSPIHFDRISFMISEVPAPMVSRRMSR